MTRSLGKHEIYHLFTLAQFLNFKDKRILALFFVLIQLNAVVIL